MNKNKCEYQKILAIFDNLGNIVLVFTAKLLRNERQGYESKTILITFLFLSICYVLFFGHFRWRKLNVSLFSNSPKRNAKKKLNVVCGPAFFFRILSSTFLIEDLKYRPLPFIFKM